MKRIVWLASYPKSGNTWIRALLANYGSGSDAPVDINALGGGPIATARMWFDEWSGIEASAIDPAVVQRLRPEVYRCLAREADETLYMKVHDAWTFTDRGDPMFPADITVGVVYILRNPLDLAASCAHHWGCGLRQAVTYLCEPDLVERDVRGLPDQLGHRLGSWSEHVQSWLDESGLPVHLVRYEDLRRDPQGTFAGVIRFCGLDENEARILRAVAFSSFDELQRQETDKGFRERSTHAPGPFFRRGEVESWRDELPFDLAARLVESHGETMRRLGYDTEEALRPIAGSR